MPNINTLLREARESKGLTIKDAAKALKLRERHIQMLEDGKLSELSKEIYLKGFLKTYTSWLNIDGIDIISKINHEKKKIVSQRNSVPVVAIGFSYLTSLARRPGLNVFILSAILTLVIYVFWSNNHKATEGVDIVSSIQKVGTQNKGEKYSNLLDQYIGKDLVFFPHASVELKVTDTGSGVENVNKLDDGDVFFLKAEDATFISSDNPGSIEVFLDEGATQEPVGTLDNILMKF